MTACAGTLASSVERRMVEPGVKPVWEIVASFVCVAADTTAAITIPINGLLKKVIYKRPNTANDDLTSQLTIADNGDNTIFDTGSGLAENDTSAYNVDEPLSGSIDLAIAFNEAVGVGATFTVTLRGV